VSQDYRELLGTDLLSPSRGYINGSFAALLSDFAGTAAPTNPAAYMIWLDTTAGLVKRRNAANDAWITIGIVGDEYGGMLPRSGGTMSGPINMGGQILSNLGLGTGLAAARVQEVDAKAPLAAPTLTGDAKVSQDPAGNDSIPRRSWTEGRYVKLAGGTMTGPLVLSGIASAALHPVGFQQVKDLVTFNFTTGHRHDGADARKVKGTSIDSESAGSKAVLLASGSGVSSWSDIPSNYCAMREDEYLLVTRTNPIAWTTYDLTGLVHASTVAAVLKVEVSGGGGYDAMLSLRPYGTTPANPQSWYAAAGMTNQATAFIRADTLKFDYKLDGSSGAAMKIYLLGYIRNV